MKIIGVKYEKMNVLITGGNFFNAGAEAMTLVAMSEVRKRNKDAKIFILCSIDEKSTINNYVDAEILEYHQRAILNMLGGVYGTYAKLKGYLKSIVTPYKYDDEILNKYQDIIKIIDLIIDVSGLVLFQKRGKKSNLDLYYMYIIMLASKRNIPIVLMPQSFGPFEYSFFPKKIWMRYLMKRYLSYPAHIYAREQESYDFFVQKMHLANVSRSADLVLQTKDISLELILKEKFNVEKISVPSDSIVIIPHVKQFSTHDLKEKFLRIYRELIDLLIKRQKNVVIICHADGDTEVAKLIADMFVQDNRVKYIDQKMNSISYSELIRQCQFAIAGRYHSIVHAYKQNVPCITFGWAEKYKEIFSLMNQSRYYFNIESVNLNEGIEAVREMCDMYKKEKIVIRSCLERVQEENCFAILDDIF